MTSMGISVRDGKYFPFSGKTKKRHPGPSSVEHVCREGIKQGES